MIEALRRLGIAARFVSGYVFIPGDRAHGYVGGGSTHAWVQVYLPSAGWIEFDPTNGIVGSRDLIRVAVARDPRRADPAARHVSGVARRFCRHGGLIGNVVSVGEEQPEAAERRSWRHGDQVGFEISYAAVQPTPMVIMLASIRRAFPTSSAPSGSQPGLTCRSASTATALAMSAAASSRPPAA